MGTISLKHGRTATGASGAPADEVSGRSAALETRVGLAGALAAGVAYLLAASPSLGWQDSGEMVSSAFQLGVPHPTGFPAVMLLAKLWSFVPLGTVAMRAAALSALSAAAAVGLAAALATRLTRSLGSPPWAAALAGAIAAVALGCSTTFLQCATGLEAYAPSLAVLLLMLLVSLPADGRPATPRAATVAGLCLGVGATTHVIVRLHGILPMVGVLASTRGRRRALAGAALAALVGTLAVAYIPLVSAGDPPMDWGDPETLSRLWDHLTGARIRRSFDGRMLNLAWVGIDTEALARMVGEDLGVVAPALAALGLGALAARRPAAALLLGLVAASDAAYSVLVNPMGIVDRQVAMPLEAVLAILAGGGAAALAVRGPRLLRRVAPPVVGVLAMVAPIQAAAEWRGPGQGPASLAASALAVPPRAAVLCISDSLCGGLAWAQYVEGDRPDVLALPRQHLWDPATMAARLPRHAPDLQDRAAAGLGVEEAVALLAERAPLLWERGADEATLRRLLGERPLAPTGPPPLFVVGGPSRPGREAAGELRRAARRWFGAEGPLDPGGREAMAILFGSLAVTVAEGGEPEVAAALLEESLEHQRRPTTLLNVAALEVRSGRAARALAWIEAALAVEPSHQRALVAAGKLHLNAGRDDRARGYFEQARALCPTRCGAPLEGLGILTAREGDLDRAEALLIEALRRDPALEDARVNLRVVRRARGDILTP